MRSAALLVKKFSFYQILLKVVLRNDRAIFFPVS